MTDQLDHHEEALAMADDCNTVPCKIDYGSLRQFILENRQQIATTIMTIDAEIVQASQNILGLGPTEYLPRTEEQIRRPIIAIVDDEHGRLIDVDDYGCILARAARGMRTVAVHRIRYEYAREFHRLV
tara:strand:+ start:1750 stop:2133 length:384 start_codon:yes stop_codon:yes gene_type:complete